MVASKLFSKRWFKWIAASASGLLITGILALTGMVENFENVSYDLRARYFGKGPAFDSPIILVQLDQTSLDWATVSLDWSWPWPREAAYGSLIKHINKGQPKVIAFDVLFTETSNAGIQDDLDFATTISQAGNVIIPGFLKPEKGNLELSEAVLAKLPSWPTGLIDHQLVRMGITPPNADLAASSASLANVQFAADDDGVYRRMPLYFQHQNRIVPSLALAAYQVGQKQNLSTLFTTAPDMSDPHLQLRDYRVPIDASNQSILHFRGPTGSYRTYTFAQILQSYIQETLEGTTPEIPSSLFKDAYVLVGFSAPGLSDIRNAASDNAIPGVEINATALENLLNQHFNYEFPTWASLLYILGLSALAGMVTMGGRKGIIAFPTIMVPFAFAIVAYLNHWWLPLIAPLLSMFFVLMVGSAINYATEGQQKRYIRQAFSQYLSPVVIQNLVQNPEALRLGGEKKEISIFFSDVQGFTSISEKLSPEDLTALLNDYLSEMSEIILASGGTIDKYEGDAIIAFWNAPLAFEDHAQRALRAAIDCQKRLAELRPRYHAIVQRDLLMRIGLNTGLAVVGNMGSKTRFDYTMLGDSVNLAARLEGVNKVFGTYTMVSEYGKAKAGASFAYRELGKFQVVGKAEAVRVYEPMFHEDYAAKQATYDTFVQGLEQWYSGDLDSALLTLNSIASHDPPAASYAERIKEIHSGTLAKPAMGGVWQMTSK